MADVFPRIFAGFLKRPSVSDVISSASPLDQTIILGCQITDFFPPNISVTWLRLREGERDDREEEVIEGGEMWGPIQTQPRLYRATATLKWRATSQEKKEKGGFGGGGIICRVEHVSLKEPIEKHWKSIDIGINIFFLLLHDFHNSDSIKMLTSERKKNIPMKNVVLLFINAFIFALPQPLPPFHLQSRCVGAAKGLVCSPLCSRGVTPRSNCCGQREDEPSRRWCPVRRRR